MNPILRDPHRGIGRFYGVLRVEVLKAPSKQTRVRYMEKFGYVSFEGWKSEIPIGFVSDGASFPPAVQPILGPPLCWSSAFGGHHDLGYRLGGLPLVDGSFKAMTRSELDLLAWDMALACGHSEESAAAIYHGLLIGGQGAWDQNVRKRVACSGDAARLLAWA